MLFLAPYRMPLNENGRVQPGAQVWFTQTGTDVEADTYSDGALTTLNPNPFIASATGRVDPIYLDPSVTYRIRLYSPWATVGVDTPLEEYDPYTGAEDGVARGQIADILTKLNSYVSVYDFDGADDAERITNAFDILEDGATLVFPGGRESVIDRVVKIGNGGDVATAKNINVVATGHKFKFTADGARLEINGPISAVMYLSANYTKGARTITITHTGTQLNDIVRGRWIKIVSDALDGWNRNQGTSTSQYRLGEFAQVRKVLDNGDGTATITLFNPLKFSRGFTNTGDAENLTEGDTYTTANNARIAAILVDGFSWNGGTFYIENPDIDAVGWDTRALLRVQGFSRPLIENVVIGPGAGKGLELAGCPNFTVNNPHINRLPDFAEQLANDAITTSYIGYGISISGCWGGVISNLVARDCRHAVTESNSTATANQTSYDTLMNIGRTYGTRIESPTVECGYSAAIDTHHGAHAWTIANAVVEGVQSTYSINLRGPNHTVIAPQLTGERGIHVISEYANSGGTDLGGLVGNGNKWMSSARIIGANMDVTLEAVRTQDAYISLEGGGKIRSRTHYLFSMQGGVIDFSSGYFEAEITGEASAATVNADTTARGIFHIEDADASYGVTWAPGALIREGANISISASAATDTQTMSVAMQTGTAGQFNLRGGLAIALPAAGFSATAFGGSLYWTIDNSATLDLSGNAGITANLPKWEKGRVKISNLAPSTAQKLFIFKDALGSSAAFWATVKVYVQDQGGGVTSMPAEYQIGDSFSAASGTETTFLLSGNTADFEANSNIDLTSVAPTAGKIGLSYKDGAVLIRHEDAGITYEDVFAQFNIYRQPTTT